MRVPDHWSTLVLPSKVLISLPLPGTPTCLWKPGRWQSKMPGSHQVLHKTLVGNGGGKCLLAHGSAITVSFEAWAPAARFLLPFLMQTVMQHYSE